MRFRDRLHRFFNPSHFSDTRLTTQRSLTMGGLPRGKKVAIYLIYPGKGLQASHEMALRELVRGGYAPIVVSNLPLTDPERQALKPLCWQILQRANFGYDFGGYREAILWLAPQFADLDRLILMNDSVWFPIPGGMDWIERAEALDVDLAGSICVGFSGRSRAHLFRTTLWQVDMSRPKVHYGSFALMLSKKLLRDAGFLQFWRQLRLSQGKTRTIKRGEIGLSQWVIRHGFRHAATSDITRFNEVLAKLSDSQLAQVFADLIIVQDDKAVRQRNILAKITPTRAEKEAFIRMVVARRGPLLSLPRMMLREFGFAFLKKYAAKPNQPDAERMAHILNDLPEPLREIVFAETGLTRTK